MLLRSGEIGHNPPHRTYPIRNVGTPGWNFAGDTDTPTTENLT